MLRRAFLLVLAVAIGGCGNDSGNPFGGGTLSRPPSAGAVLMFVSGSWSADPGQPREIFATSADGSRVERLTTCTQADPPCDLLRFAPSPQTVRLAAVRSTPDATEGKAALYFMDLSRSVEKLLFARKRVSGADWSADGSFLVYSASGEGLGTEVEDLFYCAPDGSGDQALTETAGIRERNPRIDPGARTAAYEQIAADGTSRIALYGATAFELTSGSAAGPLLPGTPYAVGSDADPAFAPDASRVVFRRLTGLGDDGLGTWDLMTIGSDGKDLRPLVSGPLHRGAPDWGKNGIAFVETDAALGRSRLVVVQPDGSGRRVVVEESAAFRMAAPRWIAAVN